MSGAPFVLDSGIAVTYWRLVCGADHIGAGMARLIALARAGVAQLIEIQKKLAPLR